ncbi:MAG: hypothetical protein KC441_08410 [Anaerolineales bacterium]|nr:hypothetical protein [Anaerolineales bacterium]
MGKPEIQEQLTEIEKQIANLEGMGGVLSAEQIQAALAPLRQKKAELESSLTGATYSAAVSGSVAVAQGEGATAVGERGVNVGGNVGGSIITGDSNTIIIYGVPSAGEAAVLPPELVPLRKLLGQYFSLSELHTLAFDLGIAHDDLPGSTRSQFAESLILHCYRQNRLEELVTLCREQRPFVTWPRVSQSR